MLFLLITAGYVFAANCYYLHTAPSAKTGVSNVVIRRGHPLLPLPGLGDVILDTGMIPVRLRMSAGTASAAERCGDFRE